MNYSTNTSNGAWLLLLLLVRVEGTDFLCCLKGYEAQYTTNGVTVLLYHTGVLCHTDTPEYDIIPGINGHLRKVRFFINQRFSSRMGEKCEWPALDRRASET